MKKKMLLSMVGLLLGLTAPAGPVDVAHARKVAETAFKMYLLEMETPIKHVDTAIGWNVAEVAIAGIDNLYLFNVYGQSSEQVKELGFVVVSGDDIAAPVLAFSTESALSSSSLKVDNPAVYSHLQRYGRQIADARQKGLAATPAIQQMWADLTTGEALAKVNAMMDTKGDYLDDNIPQLLGMMKWGQGTPYNDRCPGGSVTGCVATAFGMIMNYWDYPEHGFGMHAYNGADNPAAYPNWRYGEQYADFEHTYYDWEHMPDHAYINSPQEQKEAVSTLLYHIGVSLEMRYTPDASGCWSLPEYAMFDTSLHLYQRAYTIGADYRIPRHFGYKYSYAGMRDSIGNDSLWLTMLYNSLAERKPIYYAGWAREDNEAGHSGTSGHGYIIDGYFSDAIDTNFFHINWGWNGTADGYFKLDAMTPSGSDFTQWHGAIIGVEPDTSYHGYDYTGIRPIAIDDVLVFGRQGHISVHNALGRPIAVYDVTGRRLLTATPSTTQWNIAMRPGFYLVKVGTAQPKKIIVY